MYQKIIIFCVTLAFIIQLRLVPGKEEEKKLLLIDPSIDRAEKSLV
jgi:hypothetical protein